MCMSKICSRCKVVKDLSQFGIRKTGKRQSLCVSCNKEYHKEHYRKNKETYLTNNKHRAQRRLLWLSNLKNTLCCEVCGESRPVCLDFHHMDATTKDRNIGSTFGWSIARLEREIDKCKVLCSNCHRILHWQENMG